MRLFNSGPRRPRPLRWHFALMIAGAVLPVVVFSGLVVMRLASQMQDSVENRLQRSAHMITFAFEREMSANIRMLQALAESAALDTGELENFRAEAERVWRTQPSWLTVVLLAPDGEQLVNLGTHGGEPRHRATEPESLRHTVETLQPTVGDLARSQASQQWAFPVRVPVTREGRLRYVLTAVITPQALEDIVARQRPVEDDEFTRTIVDSHGLVAFRTRSPERFIGVHATATFRAHTRNATEGVFGSVTLEGRPSYVAFSRSTLAGWTASVVVPTEVIDAPFERSILTVVALGGLALLLSVGGAVAFSRRFAQGIHAAATAAAALAHGEQPRMEPSAIEEVQRLGESLSLSGERLRQHAQEERLAREQLEEAVRARDDFLSLASHELKTPLTSLMLQTQLLQRRFERDQGLPPEGVKRLLDQTARQTERLARLVNDMLDISRISGGKLSLERERFDLTVLAFEVVGKLGPQLSEARCEVSVRSQEPVVGEWDRYRLEQVLTNLLTNAARYGKGAPVEVSVQRRERWALLSVRDHGRGVAPADQERIFRKFERAVESHEVAGLGLGLFIVREIVEMHGGSIHVQSELGQGAIFTVELPYEEPPAEVGVPKEPIG